MNRSDPLRMHAADLGVRPDAPDCGPALREAVRKARLQTRPVVLQLEAGVYRLDSDSQQRRGGSCLPIHGAEGFTIAGAGAGVTTLLVNNPMRGAVDFASCTEVAIRDLTIDYATPPFLQGVVRRVDQEAGWFDLQIDDGYDTPEALNYQLSPVPYGRWGMIIDRATRRIRAGTSDHFMTPQWERVEGRIWRFYTTEAHYRHSLRDMQEGDAYVHLARGFGNAVMAYRCQGIAIERVTVHASPALSVGLVACSRYAIVRQLQVRFRPGSNRLITTDADGVHCQQNRIGPVITDCYFEGMADDAVNIYAPPIVLREVVSPRKLRVQPSGEIRSGDRLQVLDPRSGQIRGVVRVVAVRVLDSGVELDVDRALTGLQAGETHRHADTLYNLDACGAGYRIRRNVMNGNRRYGCMLRAGDGLVDGNRFVDTTGAGVVLTNEPDWPEGPVPWNVTIRRNRFIRGGTCRGYADTSSGAALSVRAVRLGHQPAETLAIQGVRIEDNIIEARAGIAIGVSGASNVQIQGNTVDARHSGALRCRDGHLVIDHAAGVVIRDNRIIDPDTDMRAAVTLGPGTRRGGAGAVVGPLSLSPPGRLPLLRDERPASTGRKE